ncbi:MAG: hypothetical protein R3B90_22855 [Planctomycetaceae bacterium]
MGWAQMAEARPLWLELQRVRAARALIELQAAVTPETAAICRDIERSRAPVASSVAELQAELDALAEPRPLTDSQLELLSFADRVTALQRQVERIRALQQSVDDNDRDLRGRAVKLEEFASVWGDDEVPLVTIKLQQEFDTLRKEDTDWRVEWENLRTMRDKLDRDLRKLREEHERLPAQESVEVWGDRVELGAAMAA